MHGDSVNEITTHSEDRLFLDTYNVIWHWVCPHSSELYQNQASNPVSQDCPLQWWEVNPALGVFSPPETLPLVLSSQFSFPAPTDLELSEGPEFLSCWSHRNLMWCLSSGVCHILKASCTVRATGDVKEWISNIEIPVTIAPVWGSWFLRKSLKPIIQAITSPS